MCRRPYCVDIPKREEVEVNNAFLEVAEFQEAVQVHANFDPGEFDEAVQVFHANFDPADIAHAEEDDEAWLHLVTEFDRRAEEDRIREEASMARDALIALEIRRLQQELEEVQRINEEAERARHARMVEDMRRYQTEIEDIVEAVYTGPAFSQNLGESLSQAADRFLEALFQWEEQNTTY